METSKFSFNINKLSPITQVRSRTKSSNTMLEKMNCSKPLLILSPTFGHFKITKAGADMLKLKVGQSITMFPNPDAQHLGEQILIAKTPLKPDTT